MIPQTTADPAPDRLEQAARQLRLSPERLVELLDRGRRLQAAHDDLIAFARLMNPAWEPAQHLVEIAARLPTARGAGRRLIVTVPPRHGKSLLCSTFLPAWLLGRDPTAQVISVSYGQDLATSFGRQVRNLMASEVYGHVFTAPIAADSRAVDEFRTAAGGSYIARGIGGGVTGYGGDLIIVDDPYRNRQDADSRPRSGVGAGVLPLDALHAADAGRLDRADLDEMAPRRPRRAAPGRVWGGVGGGAVPGA